MSLYYHSPAREAYLTGPNPFERFEDAFAPDLCIGVPGASTSNGRACRNEATTGDMCEECKREMEEHLND